MKKILLFLCLGVVFNGCSGYRVKWHDPTELAERTGAYTTVQVDADSNGYVDVAAGGTNAPTFTDGGILLGSGTAAVTALGVAANGEIPIGDGTTDPTLGTISGTANEVTVTNGPGTITISLPNHAGTDISADLEEEVTEGSLADDTITEAELKCTNAATDNYVLTYDAASGGYTWVTPGTGSGDLLANGTTPLTANWDVGAFTLTGTRFISDIATGTAPFGVSSTTVVTNLNSDLLDGESASAFQDADTTLTDIADGTIVENLVNTANPWADNEVANDISLTNITQITNRAITNLSATNWRLFYSGAGGVPVELALGASGTVLTSNGASAAPTFETPGAVGTLDNVVEDTTPQLGGNLDVNGNEIQSSTDVVIQLGDNAGANEFSIQDSDGSDIFSVNSNGGISSGASSGVSITGSNGVLTMLGLGDGFDENLVWDFNTTSNEVGVSSTNGATNIVFGSIYLNFLSVATDFIPVGWMVADGTTDPGALTAEDNLSYRNFDPSSGEDLEFIWDVPPDFSGTTIKVQVIGLITNATAPASGEGISWGISACSSGDDDTHDCTAGTEVNSEDADIDSQIQWDYVIAPYVEVTPTNLAPGELCHIFINRDVADADDDYIQDVGLVAVRIKYVRLNDATY